MSQSDAKVVLITGCSSGIGHTTAIELANAGFKVYATMRDITKNRLNNNNIKVRTLDIDSESSIEEAINEILEKENKIDVLVNNAGYGLIGSIEDTTIDEIKAQFETDFFGPVRMMKKIIPTMRQNKSGKIINISSISGQMGFALSSAYSSSKYALEGMTDSLRQELKQHGISLSLIEPGVVKTNFHQNMKIAEKSNNSIYSEMTKTMVKQAQILFERGIDAKEVAKTILDIINLEKPEPRYVVGEDAEFLMDKKKRQTGLEFENTVQELFKDVMTFSN